MRVITRRKIPLSMLSLMLILTTITERIKPRFVVVAIKLNVVFVVYYEAMGMVLLFMKNHVKKIRNVDIIVRVTQYLHHLCLMVQFVLLFLRLQQQNLLLQGREKYTFLQHVYIVAK